MSDLTITDVVGDAWWFIAAVLIVGFAIQGAHHQTQNLWVSRPPPKNRRHRGSKTERSKIKLPVFKGANISA